MHLKIYFDDQRTLITINKINHQNSTGYLLGFVLPNLSTRTSRLMFLTHAVSVQITSKSESLSPPIVSRIYVFTLFRAEKNVLLMLRLPGVLPQFGLAAEACQMHLATP